jgi:hypothetical protein
MRTNSGIQRSGLDVQKPKNLSSDLEKVGERKREKATYREKLKQMKLGDGEKFILAVMPGAGLLKIASTIHTEVQGGITDPLDEIRWISPHDIVCRLSH